MFGQGDGGVSVARWAFFASWARAAAKCISPKLFFAASSPGVSSRAGA